MEKNLPSSKIQEHVQKVTSKIVPRLTEWLEKKEIGKISFEIHTSQGGISNIGEKSEKKL